MKQGIPPSDYIEIITDLNLVLRTSYKTNPVAADIKRLINGRFKDGFTIQDFFTVHRKMYKAWNNESKMKPYLRPQTLYTGKFQSYLNWPETEQKNCAYDAKKPCYFDCPGCDYVRK